MFFWAVVQQSMPHKLSFSHNLSRHPDSSVCSATTQSYHAAFAVSDDGPSDRHEIQDQAEANQPVFDTSLMTLRTSKTGKVWDRSFLFLEGLAWRGLKYRVFLFRHCLQPLVVWWTLRTGDKCATCCLNAMVQFSHVILQLVFTLQLSIVNNVMLTHIGCAHMEMMETFSLLCLKCLW